MDTKICKKCNIEKELSEFTKNKRMKGGYKNECKLCNAKYAKTWGKNNKDKVKIANRKYYDNNKNYFSNFSKTYREDNLQRIKENQEIYNKKYKEKHGETYANRWQREHKKETAKRINHWYHNNIEECRKKANCRKQTYKLLKDRGIDKDNQHCIVCGAKNAIIHHWDYNNPFDIEWYCTDCHMKLHKILKEEKYDKN